MRNFIIETVETVRASYNVLVEDGEGEDEARAKFARGEYDGHLQTDAQVEDVVSVREAE